MGTLVCVRTAGGAANICRRPNPMSVSQVNVHSTNRPYSAAGKAGECRSNRTRVFPCLPDRTLIFFILISAWERNVGCVRIGGSDQLDSNWFELRQMRQCERNPKVQMHDREMAGTVTHGNGVVWTT